MRFFQKEKRDKGSVAVSIGLHVLFISSLLTVVFRYPLGQLMGHREPAPEQLRYIAIPRPPTENSGGRSSGAPRVTSAPARLVAPQVTPTQLPVPSIAIEDLPARAAGGLGDGFGVTSSGLATGLVPRLPDPRIRVTAPDAAYRVPRSVAEDVDSIIDIAVGIALDTVEILRREGKLPEWIKTTKSGAQWGLTPTYIALGKFKIPTALLALLPLNIGPGRSPIDVRREAYIRADIMSNAARTISEDEFRRSVKRIRERKEREKKEKALQEKDVKAPDPKPIPAGQIP